MKSQTFFSNIPAADIHRLLHRSTISVRGPHVAPSLYFIWWRKIELSMLIKSNSALMRRRLSNFAERSQTTSLQLVPDAGDHVIERLTHTSSARPHTSTVASQLFSLPSNITGSLGEINGEVYSAFWRRSSRLWRGKNSKNHKNDELAQFASLSRVHWV